MDKCLDQYKLIGCLTYFKLKVLHIFFIFEEARTITSDISEAVSNHMHIYMWKY